MIRLLFLCLSLYVTIGLCKISYAYEGYYRYPHARLNTLVFVSEGDIFKVSIQGGVAERLTSHLGVESHPLISPDGRFVVFSANYEGPTEVYQMPIIGGYPIKLSDEHTRSIVVGFDPLGRVLYTTQNPYGPASSMVVISVDPHTLSKQTLPFFDTHDASFTPDGAFVFLSRMGLTLTADNARHYRGGAYSQLWRASISTKQEATRLNDKEHPIRKPMASISSLYYISDEDGYDNLWSMAFDGSQKKQLTHHHTFQINYASMGDPLIAYQLGADIHVYDINKNQDRLIPVQIQSDLSLQRHKFIQAQKLVSQITLAPQGQQAAIIARGRLAALSVPHQRLVEWQNFGAQRILDVAYAADGRSLFIVVNKNPNQKPNLGPQIYQLDITAKKEPVQITQDPYFEPHGLTPSPDGQWLAYHDGSQYLRLLNLKNKAIQTIDDAGHYQDVDNYRDIVWSKNSQHVVFVRPNSTLMINQLIIYNIANQQQEILTSDRYSSFSPVFSTDNQWLYFISERTLNPYPSSPWNDHMMGVSFYKKAKVYALALQQRHHFPFHTYHELDPMPTTPSPQPNALRANTENLSNKKTTLPNIETDNLKNRLYEVPLPAGRYRQLQVDTQRLYVLDFDDASNSSHAELKSIAITQSKDPKIETLSKQIQAFVVSDNAKKILLKKYMDEQNSNYYIIDAAAQAPADMIPFQIRLADWKIQITPREEWRSIFDNAWQMERTYFFDKSMRGVDWNHVKTKYTPLLERISERPELDDVLAQMIAELGVLHSQIRPTAAKIDQDNAPPAFLGAVLKSSPTGVIIEHIYQSEIELPQERAPLLHPQVNAQDGDIILAVNYQPVKTTQDVYEQLKNRANQAVILTLKQKQRVFDAMLTPIDSDRMNALRYSDWEYKNKQIVLNKSQGQMGYLHLRMMGKDDLAQFAREFYSQTNKQALIIDVRRNKGGNIDSILIEKLLRQSFAFWQKDKHVRNFNQQSSFQGPIAVLIDEGTYSDGETFAAAIKSLGLAKIIGTRTAGAGVWLSARTSLVDQGMMRAPETPQFSMDGRWIIEGLGVKPDEEVENLPRATFMGQDAQLETAIEYLRQTIKQHPIQSAPAQPIKPYPAHADEVERIH